MTPNLLEITAMQTNTRIMYNFAPIRPEQLRSQMMANDGGLWV